MSNFWSIVFGILLFSFLIFIHELGHFLAAKASKVQVNEFSMFMGPAIFKKQVGETLYSIRCIPIGGYCAMEGEDEDTDNPRSFQKARWWKRLIILAAGSAMNFIAGFLLFAIVFAPMKEVITPAIDSFESYSTIDGLQVGDEILKVDGEWIYVSDDITLIMSLKGGNTHDFLVRRNGEKVLLEDVKMEAHLTKDKNGNDVMRYGMNLHSEDANFGNKLCYIWNYTIDNVRNTRLSLQMLVTGQASFKDMSGAVGIVDMMTDVAASSPSWTDALLNLLSLPALDGGRIVGLMLTTVIEAITRKKINPKYEGYIHAVGMILLLVLMAVITFKDIFTIFKG